MIEVPDGVVERARQGDVEAFRALLELFEEPVFQTVYRLIGGRHASEVEDVTQEVFLKLFRSLERFDASRGVKFSTWVYTFVKNHCFDVLKKRRLRMLRLDAGSDETGPSPIDPRTATAGPGERLIAGEMNALIGNAVLALPEEQRLVFVLREYQHLDYRDIAAVAGCTEGTVKSRLHRAKDALRQALRRHVVP